MPLCCSLLCRPGLIQDKAQALPWPLWPSCHQLHFIYGPSFQLKYKLHWGESFYLLLIFLYLLYFQCLGRELEHTRLSINVWCIKGITWLLKPPPQTSRWRTWSYLKWRSIFHIGQQDVLYVSPTWDWTSPVFRVRSPSRAQTLYKASMCLSPCSRWLTWEGLDHFGIVSLNWLRAECGPGGAQILSEFNHKENLKILPVSCSPSAA